jgi:hypothetical protein
VPQKGQKNNQALKIVQAALLYSTVQRQNIENQFWQYFVKQVDFI